MSDAADLFTLRRGIPLTTRGQTFCLFCYVQIAFTLYGSVQLGMWLSSTKFWTRTFVSIKFYPERRRLYGDNWAMLLCHYKTLEIH